MLGLGIDVTQEARLRGVEGSGPAVGMGWLALPSPAAWGVWGTSMEQRGSRWGLWPAEHICNNVVKASDRIGGEAVRWVVQRRQNLDRVPTAPFPGRDPRELKAGTGRDVCTATFVAAL